MSKEKKVIYEPHPVSAERKAELVGEGFKIVDAVFAPADAWPVDPIDPIDPIYPIDPVDPIDGEDATKKQKPKG